jgi:hypothetical protein
MSESAALRGIKQIGALIERANSLEARMAYLIDLFVGASGLGREFLRSRVLHNSIISYAGKIKLILAINRTVGGPKINRDKLHRLGMIRNAFAHGQLAESIRKVRDPAVGTVGEFVVVETLKGDGSIQEMNRADAINEFVQLHKDLVKQFDELGTGIAIVFAVLGFVWIHKLASIVSGFVCTIFISSGLLISAYLFYESYSSARNLAKVRKQLVQTLESN